MGVIVANPIMGKRKIEGFSVCISGPIIITTALNIIELIDLTTTITISSTKNRRPLV